MKYLIAIIFIFLLVFLLFGFSVFSGFFVFSDFFSSPGLDGREVLLKQTDCPELLKAGREIVRKVEQKEHTYKPATLGDYFLVIPKDANESEYIQVFSKKLSEIKGLKFSILAYKAESLEIFFDGERETGHFGICIYSEDFNEPENKHANQDDIMIMPGMRYFDNAYHEFPKLRKKNLSNIKKNMSLKNK